jgi:N6-adenosine-specific RNA methylase IME4
MGKLVRIPDLGEITIGPFRLTERGLEVTGRPSFGEYEGVGEFIKRTFKASSWWMADWLRYGESREDWKERLSQAHHITGVSEKTLKNVRAVGAIPAKRRRLAVEFSLHAELAGLEDDERDEWLERAEMEGWTRAELRLEMRAAKRRRVIQGQATLQGLYRVIYADPAWQYGDSGVIAGSAYGRAEAHYGTMSIEELCKLPVKAHAMPNAVLLMWVPVPLLLENPGPREVVEAWGFTYKGNFTWDKVLGMPGAYNHVTHEHLIICTRGDGKPDVPTPQPKSVVTIRRSDIHSQKPEEFRKLIERHWTMGPYLELFGRERVEGWTVFGNDARLWAEEAIAS